jgi:hypothetical protein
VAWLCFCWDSCTMLNHPRVLFGHSLGEN